MCLFLGRLQEKKGCDLLIQAFARVAARDERLRLVMAGPGDEAWVAHLKELAHKAGIADRIVWTGMLTGDLKWAAFYACELFCLPSHQENFGIAVAEALACGRPVAISDKVNIWREVETDEAGWVAPDTVEGTVRSLQGWLDATPQELARRGQAARRSFERRYKIDQAARSLMTIVGGRLPAPAH